MAGTVLFGDDGSSFADLAWMWINVQRWDGWTIDVLTAGADEFGGPATPVPWDPPRPRALVDPAVAAGVRHLRSPSDPRVALLEYPGKDLIVIGPRGGGLLKAMHLGSTADWLMHDPPAPLVIVRRGRPVRTAMLCTDGSDDAMAAADALAAMPWLPDVEVTVLAVEQQGFDADAATGRAAARLGRAAGVRERCIARSQAGALVNVRDCILALLGKTDPDLLVQGTAGLSTWGALRAGSIASSLAAHAPCSVLMARAPRT